MTSGGRDQGSGRQAIDASGPITDVNDPRVQRYRALFDKFDVPAERRIMLAQRFDNGMEKPKEWQKRNLEAIKKAKKRELAAEAKEAPTKEGRALAVFKLAALEAFDIGKMIVSVPKELGEGTVRNPWNPTEGLKAKERDKNRKKLKAQIKAQKGGYVDDAGPGIVKVKKKLLGFDMYVVNKGTTQQATGATPGRLADGKKVNCYVVTEMGFRVVKERADYAKWLADNAEFYLVRSSGKGGAYDKSRHERFEQTEAVYGRSPDEEAEKLPVDDATGQPIGMAAVLDNARAQALTEAAGEKYVPPTPVGTRIAIEWGPFAALLSEDEQFEVISQGSLVLDLIKRAAGVTVAATSGMAAEKVHGEEIAKQGEGIKTVMEGAKVNIEALDWLTEVVKGKVKKSAPTFYELVFSWQGGRSSVPTQADHVNCTEHITIGDDHYEGIRIGDISKNLQ